MEIEADFMEETRIFPSFISNGNGGFLNRDLKIVRSGVKVGEGCWFCEGVWRRDLREDDGNGWGSFVVVRTEVVRVPVEYRVENGVSGGVVGDGSKGDGESGKCVFVRAGTLELRWNRKLI